MKLVEVNTKRQIKAFHRVPFEIYNADKNWIPNIRQDIDKIFDPNKNKLYKEGGETIRWVLYDASNDLIGRVAAFINPRTLPKTDDKKKIGGLGFFECINDQKAANVLFEACQKWLSEKGIEGMDGSINFGERNEFWGVLIENFDDPPNYQVNYNPPYYKNLFESFGFRIYFNQILFKRLMHTQLSPMYKRVYDKVMADKKFEIKNIVGHPLTKVAEDFRAVYNGAWATHKGFKPMKPEAAQKIMKALKPIIDRRIIVFVYYDQNPIAFYVNIPELNEIFKHVNGNMNGWGKLKFLYYQRFQKRKTMTGIVFGVVKEWHGKGIDAAMIKWYRENIVDSVEYEDTVLTWIGDFNPKMIKVAQLLGGKEYRKLATFRIYFDPSVVFERHPMINT